MWCLSSRNIEQTSHCVAQYWYRICQLDEHLGVYHLWYVYKCWEEHKKYVYPLFDRRNITKNVYISQMIFKWWSYENQKTITCRIWYKGYENIYIHSILVKLIFYCRVTVRVVLIFIFQKLYVWYMILKIDCETIK